MGGGGRPEHGTGRGVVSHPESQNDPRSVVPLVYACASGWAATFDFPDVAIAKLLTIVLAYGTGVTAEAARAIMPAAGMIASAHKADFLTLLRMFLVGVLTDSTDRFQMSEDVATRTVQNALSDYA